VAIVVGGVASAQGAWESHVQGEGLQVGPFNGPGGTEVLDLMEPFRNDWTPASNEQAFGLTGEPDTGITRPSGSEGAGRKRTPVMVQRAALRPYVQGSEPCPPIPCTSGDLVAVCSCRVAGRRYRRPAP